MSCVINTEDLRYWIEGNEVFHDTDPLMTVRNQDTDGRTCSTEGSTPILYRSASLSGSLFPFFYTWFTKGPDDGH